MELQYMSRMEEMEKCDLYTFNIPCIQLGRGILPGETSKVLITGCSQTAAVSKIHTILWVATGYRCSKISCFPYLVSTNLSVVLALYCKGAIPSQEIAF